jgi:hypothetical protein
MRTILMVAAFVLAGCTASDAPTESDPTTQSSTTDPATASLNATENLASQSFTGSWALPGGSPVGCVGPTIKVPPRAEGKGVWYDSFAVDNATIGQPFLVQFKWAAAVPYSGAGFAFVNDAGQVVESWHTFNYPEFTLNGTVPMGAATGYMYTCESAPATTADYYAGPRQTV